MSTIRTRLAALEARLSGDEQAGFERRLAAMTDAELEAEITAYEATHPMTDDEIRASVTTGEFTPVQAEELIALRGRSQEARS